MKKRILVIACAACFACMGSAGAAVSGKAPSAAALPVAPVLPALSAQQIVDRNVAARGGLEAWKRVQTLSFEGKLDAGRRRVDGGWVGKQTGTRSRAEEKAEMRHALFTKSESGADKIIQLPFKMEFKRPRQSRIEIEFQGKTAVQVYDGTNGWKLRPYLGRHEVETFNATEMKAAAQQQELDGPLIDHAAKGIKVETAGTETVDGHDTYKLALTLKGGEKRNVWIDAHSFLEIKMDGVPRRMDGKPRAVSTYFQDYKPVNGLMLPHLIETRVDGVHEKERILVEHVALNPPLDNALFTKPK